MISHLNTKYLKKDGISKITVETFIENKLIIKNKVKIYMDDKKSVYTTDIFDTEFVEILEFSLGYDTAWEISKNVDKLATQNSKALGLFTSKKLNNDTRTKTTGTKII